MAETVEVSPDITARLDQHVVEGENDERFVEEEVYPREPEGNHLWEGWAGEP